MTNAWLAQYNIFSLIFSWFALANLWLTFAIIIDLLPTQNLYAFGNAEVVSDRSLFASHELVLIWRSMQTHWVNFAFKAIYLFFLALQVGNRFLRVNRRLFC